MHVLHVTQPVDGGVGHYVRDLATATAATGATVTVASPPGWLPDELDAAVRWVRWDAVRAPGRSVTAETAALRHVVAEAAPDVVHLHSSKAGLAGRLVLRKRRATVFQPHGWPWQAVEGAVAAATVGWERWAARWADTVVCVSDAERVAGESRGVRAAYEVVRNGVDLDDVTVATPAQRLSARRRLDLPADAPVTTVVGRLNAQKGQEGLVAAWPQVRRRVPGALLVLVGTGPDHERIAHVAATGGVADAVRFVGEVPDARPYYAACDVVAFTSRWGEAMALTPLEAMASGRPVVATDVAGVRESLGVGCGAVVPPGDTAAFVDALVTRLTDAELVASEGAAARRHAEAHLDVRASHAALVALAERLSTLRRA